MRKKTFNSSLINLIAINFIVIVRLFFLTLPCFGDPFTHGKSTLTEKETAIIHIIESFSRPITNSERTTYRWQNKATGQALLETGIDSNQIFKNKGEVGNNQKMGSGLYVSLNFYDSSGYAPKDDATLVKISLPADKQVLDLRDPYVLSKLQHAGITLDDIARFDPKVLIRYMPDGTPGDWMCIKDITGAQVQEFDGMGFSTKDLINFQAAIQNPTALNVYRNHLNRILTARSARSAEHSNPERCRDPRQPSITVAPQLMTDLQPVLYDNYAWSTTGQCLVKKDPTSQLTETTVTQCLEHIPPAQVIAYSGQCYYYNQDELLVDIRPEKDCPPHAKRPPSVHVYNPQTDFSEFSRLNPTIQLDPRAIPSEKLKRSYPADAIELNLLKENHLNYNPSNQRYEVLVKTTKGFKVEDFSTEQEALDALKTIPDPINFKHFIQFKKRVFEDFQKDLKIILGFRLPMTLEDPDELKKEIFSASKTKILSYENFFSHIQNEPIRGEIILNTQQDLKKLKANLTDYFQNLKSPGFFKMQIKNEMDDHGNESANLIGHIRGTPFNIRIDTHDSIAQFIYGSEIEDFLARQIQIATPKHPPILNNLLEPLREHYAAQIDNNHSFDVFLVKKTKEALTPHLEKHIHSTFEVHEKKILKGQMTEKMIVDQIHSTYNKSQHPVMVDVINSTSTNAIERYRNRTIRPSIHALVGKNIDLPTLMLKVEKKFNKHKDPELTQYLKNQVYEARIIHNIQKHLSSQIQEVLNDFYQTPMPKRSDIEVLDTQQKRVKWSQLTLEQKRTILKANHIRSEPSDERVLADHPFPHLEHEIPRWMHGPEHIARVAMEIDILAKLYKKYDSNLVLTDLDITLAKYLVAFHDSARQSEGLDLWDDESAENARNYLIKAGFQPTTVEKCINDIKQKDLPKDDPHYQKRSLISKLIHDADSLDRIRVSGRLHYDIKYLDLYTDYNESKGIAKKLNRLADDVNEFVMQTESEEKKKEFKKAANYYTQINTLARATGSSLRKWLDF